MDEVLVLRLKADALRNKKRYKEALLLYKQCIDLNKDNADKFLYFRFGQCLYYMQHYDKVLKLCKYLRKKFPGFEHINHLFAWALYKAAVKQPEALAPHILNRAVKKIFDLCPAPKPFTPYTLTLLNMMEYYNEQRNARYPPFFYGVVSNTNVSLLDSKPFDFRKGKKTIKIPSDRERFFSLYIEYYIIRNQNEKCIEVCDKALSSVQNYTNDNDIWWMHKKANCLRQLGQYEQALDLLQYIVQYKKDWYFYAEISRILLESDHPEKALDYAIIAALRPSKPDFKVNLYALMIELLLKNRYYSYIRELISLTLALRKKNKWNIPPQLYKEAKRWQIFDVSQDDIRHLIHANIRNWNKLKYRNTPCSEGVVTKLLKGGLSGFIRDKKTQKSYYFNTKSYEGDPKRICKGLEVIYYTRKGYDKKRCKVSTVVCYFSPSYSAPAP